MVSVYGRLFLARASAAVNLAVAIICIVFVMRWIVRTAIMRFLSSRIWAIGGERIAQEAPRFSPGGSLPPSAVEGPAGERRSAHSA